MNIYLKWKANDTFVPSHLSLFDLDISQIENEFAKTLLVVDALAILPQVGTVGRLEKEDGTILFKGQLRGCLNHTQSYFSTIELIAIPDDFQEQSRTLQKDSRVHPYWNDLWIKPDKHKDDHEIQTVKTASLYCDRVTQKLSWSDWFKGTQTIILDPNFFQDSLRIQLLTPPLTACTVNVTAHWIQSESGVDSVSRSIRRAFPHFKMSTYTHKSLSTKWPQPGQNIGKSGIWIIRSDLKPMSPIGKIYKQYSPEITLGKEGKTYRALRHWFKPILWVGWRYFQKRTETLSVTLHHNVSSFIPKSQDHKTVEYTLQNINPDPKSYPWQPETYYAEGNKVVYENKIYRCHKAHTSDLYFHENKDLWIFKKQFHTSLGHPARNSFFLTDQGYIAAEHAMERAKVELAKSARCLKISFEGTWDYLEKVTTDTSVRLSDSRFPKGILTGKVVKYQLIARGETGERFVRVTLLASVESEEMRKVNLRLSPTYGFSDYCARDYQVHENACGTTPTGLQYFRYDDQTPPRQIQRGPVLRGVKLENGPLDQESTLLATSFETPEHVEKTLSQNATRLRLYFKDLRTKERLEHRISVKMAVPWTAPFPH